DSTTGAARRTNPRVCVAARSLTSRKTEVVSVSVPAFALRCASQSTTAPVSSTSPHTPSTSFARKLSPRAPGAEIGSASGTGEVIAWPGCSALPRRSERSLHVTTYRGSSAAYRALSLTSHAPSASDPRRHHPDCLGVLSSSVLALHIPDTLASRSPTWPLPQRVAAVEDQYRAGHVPRRLA